ncbi:hypothetical protein [Anaeroselena agilis]|uniref:hypothetical protein n=1 Tax=Anaeroselena agilis TaxID=3063788 RepID=UPI0039B6F1A9
MVAERRSMMRVYGPCAKRRVVCVIESPNGEVISVGENLCLNPQKICPRKSGEGYEKCISVCQQVGHAEVVAAKQAGALWGQGGTAYLMGHTYACGNCERTLREIGVNKLVIVGGAEICDIKSLQ